MGNKQLAIYWQLKCLDGGGSFTAVSLHLLVQDRQDLYHLENKSTCSCVCEELIICIHPNDIKKYNVNIEDIVDFIRLNCMNANFSRISDTPEGQTIT